MLEFCEGRRNLEAESVGFEKVVGVCKAAGIGQVQGFVGWLKELFFFCNKFFFEKKRGEEGADSKAALGQAEPNPTTSGSVVCLFFNFIFKLLLLLLLLFWNLFSCFC